MTDSTGSTGSHGPAPDLILTGGRISTMSTGPHHPTEVQAVAIRNGLITAVGSTADIIEKAGNGTAHIPLDGRRVVPGLIDSHVHVVRAGRTWNDEVRWQREKTLSSALEAVRRAAAVRPPGTWIRVIGGWDPDQFPERRGPTPEELDAVAPDHLVYVQFSYDWAVLNRAAVAGFRLDQETIGELGPDNFERDATGALTGRLYGLALMKWCYRRMPAPDFEAQVASTAAMCRELNRLGITGAIDGGGLSTGPDTYRAFYETWRRGELTVRTRMVVHASEGGREREELSGYRRFTPLDLGDDLLRVLGAGEIILYRSHDRIATGADVSADAQAQMYELFAGLARDRWTAHMHVHQPETIEAVLSVWRRVHREVGIDGLRWALVHAEPLLPEYIPQLLEMGVGILTQPLLRTEGEEAIRVWGAERVAESPPLRALREAAVPVGLGSDATRAAPYDPFLNMAWYFRGETLRGTRTLAEHNLLTREQALRGYTDAAAWFSFEEQVRGRIEVGMQADLAVLTDDYFSIPAEQIPDLESVLTLVGGRIVHAADSMNVAVDETPAHRRPETSRGWP